MKRLRSTETLGSTSAINSDKTGTLTLNQMTAVELTIPGRRYTIDGNGYSTEGRIKRVAGQSDVDLEQFMLPLILASRRRRARRRDDRRPDRGRTRRAGREGRLRLVGDARDVPARRRAAVRHGVQADGDVPPDEGRVGPRRRPLLRQGRAGPGARPRDADAQRPTTCTRSRSTTRCAERYEAENERLGEQGLRVLATRARTSTRRSFDPNADLLPLLDGLDAARARRHRRPAAADRQGRDRDGAFAPGSRCG